jgi:GNAT superfamily N-acetyltransferase
VGRHNLGSVDAFDGHEGRKYDGRRAVMFASAGESMPVVRDVLLRDGSTLRLQAPTPTDFDDIRGFFDGLSADSRFMRFHGYARTDVAARAAVEAGGPDRCSLIARHDGQVVAVAGFDGLREMRAAEVAFAVADDFQRRGAATRMLEQLAEIATERGITRFDAEVLFTNRAMLGVFGLPVVTEQERTLRPSRTSVRPPTTPTRRTCSDDCETIADSLPTAALAPPGGSPGFP